MLGIPTRFSSNTSELAGHIEDAFGPWRVLDDIGYEVVDQPAAVRILVHETPAPVTFRMPDSERVLMTTGDTVMATYPRRREAVAYVPARALEDRQNFRYSIVELTTLALLSQLDRQPLHACAVVLDGTALLLCGPSGTGKSTLAYLLAREGYALLTDDVVSVQQSPTLRLWGMPHFLHLTADARRFFPELAGLSESIIANGKQKLVVRARDCVPVVSHPFVDRAIICLLRRDGRQPSVTRVSADTAVQELSNDFEEGFDVFTQRLGGALATIAAAGAYRLDLGDSPLDLLPLIEQIFADAASSA